MIYKCWLGKPNHFAYEVKVLQELLRDFLLKDLVSLILSTEPMDHDWIGNVYYQSWPTGLKNGQVCLLTSGTTGTPKEIWKDLSEVLVSKKGRGGPDDKWLLTYNPARWAGLSVILHTIKTNSQLIVPNDLTPKDILEKIPEATHISLTPSLFRKLLICGYEQLKLANIKQVTFGGEYAIQKVLDDAKELWPSAKVTHIYATTEFGDICACSDGYEGLPVDKLKVPFELTSRGELVLNGQGTKDLWELENNRLYFVGRETEIINVGGAKISESVIEKATNNISGIKECKAYPITNALLGQVVGLDYVGDVNASEVKKELFKVLPRFAVPVKINKVEEVLLTSAGKINRK